MGPSFKGIRRMGLRGIVAGVSLCALGGGIAVAQPDLVINVTDSEVRGVSCAKDSPLAAGRIAIKNIGTTRAVVKLLDRATRSMLAVYVPENIDMIDKRTKGEQLDAFDQEGIQFEVGAGVDKRGRFFGNPPARVSTAIPTVTGARPTDRIRAIQRALTNLGFDTKGIDGVFGSNTREAVSAYQRSQNAKATGQLTERQLDTLLDRQSPGSEIVPASGARGVIEVKLYAVVDPYNLVQESNEANNIVQFTVRIDCSK